MNESPENQDASDVPTSDAAEPTAIAADGDAQEALDDAAPVMDGDADIGGPVAPMEVVTVADEVTPPEEPTPEEPASEEPDAVADALAPEAETPEEVVAMIHRVLEHVPASRLLPCTNCGMAPLPREVARGKLRALGRGTALVRAELG